MPGNLIEGVDETNSNPNRHPAVEALLEPGAPLLGAGAGAPLGRRLGHRRTGGPASDPLAVGLVNSRRS